MNNQWWATLLVAMFGATTAIVFWEWQKYLKHKYGLDYSEIMDYALMSGWGAVVLLESWIIFSILGV